MSVALDPAPIPPDSGPRTSRWWLGAGAFVLLFFGLLLAGGEASDFAAAGFEAVPFAVLALLTYAGVRMPWARSLAWILLALLTTAVAALSVSATVDVVDTWVDGDATGWASLGLVCGGVVGGLLVGWSCCARRVRSALAGWLPIDPDSFVHQVALIAVISITIVSCVPVLVLGEPPLLASANDSGLEGSIRGDLYGLFWLLPTAMIAVGYPLTRGFGAALARLGLLRPTRVHVLAGLLGGAGMVLLFIGVDSAIGELWQRLGWPTTDAESFDELMAYSFTPLGALVVGVTAGLGEEVAVRGVLQPRLGLLLSNLFFTSLHAFQYNLDGLVSVFLAGLLLGWVRSRSDTTTSAIMHGSYDFLLIMLTVSGW